MKKRMFKLWLTAGCILLILFSFSACGDDKKSDDADVDTLPPSPTLDASSIDSIIECYNYSLDRLTSPLGESSSDSDAQLTDLLSKLNLSADDFTYQGANEQALNRLVIRDGLIYVSGEEEYENGKSLPYSTVAKLYEMGYVTVSTVGEKTTPTIKTYSEASDESINVADTKKIIEAFRLKPSDITALSNEKEYRIENTYIIRVAEAIGITDISETIKKSCTLTLDLSEYKEDEGKISLLLNLPTIDIRATLEWKDTEDSDTYTKLSITADEMIIEAVLSYNKNAAPLPADAKYTDCKNMKLSVKLKVGDEERLALTVNAAELEGNRCAGYFVMRVEKADEESESKDSLLLSFINGILSDNLRVDGSFDIGLDDQDSPISFKFSVIIRSSDINLTLNLEANKDNLKIKGGEALRFKLTAPETKDGKEIENEMLLTLTTENYSDGQSTLGLLCTMTDEGEDRKITATVHSPAKYDIPISEEVEEYFLRAETVFEDYDEIIEKIKALNERAIVYGKSAIPKGAPHKFYCYDSEIDQYLFTDFTVSGNRIYVNTQCVLNYEEMQFYYCKHSGDFTYYVDSEGIKEARKVDTLIEKEREGYAIVKNKQFLLAHYLPERGVYLLMNSEQPEAAEFYTESEMQELRLYNKIHEITEAADGTVSIHNYEKRYDSDCRCYYTCVDCGFEKVSLEIDHVTSDEIVIRRGTEGEPRATFSNCENCDKCFLNMTDQNGNLLQVLLVPAKNLYYEYGNYGDGDLVIKGFKHLNSEAQYDGPLYIPVLDTLTEYRIVGAISPGVNRGVLQNELILPEGLEFIGQCAFMNCGFTSITLPSSLKRVDEKAFYKCKATEIVIPENVTYVGYNAFFMSTLQKTTVNALNIEVFHLPDYTTFNEIVYNGRIEHFVGNNSYTIETIVIPEGVVSVEGFGGNAYVTKIVLPSTLKSISSYAFWECTSLKEVVLPDGILTIDDHAFEGCTSLIRISIADGAQGEDGKLIFPDTLQSFGANSFSGCNSIEEFYFPASVTSVPAAMFSRCANLRKVELHDEITEIGTSAFSYCQNLSEFVMSDGITVIRRYAFSGCTSLGNECMVFGSKLKTIEERAFTDCTSISSVYLPENVALVHETAFYGCNIDNFYIAGTLNHSDNHGVFGASVNELTLEKGLTGSFPIAKTINILCNEMPVSYTVSNISSKVAFINFAGTKEAWEQGRYQISGSTKINFNVVFE